MVHKLGLKVGVDHRSNISIIYYLYYLPYIYITTLYYFYGVDQNIFRNIARPAMPFGVIVSPQQKTNLFSIRAARVRATPKPEY